LLIQGGYDIAFECSAKTPLLLMVHIRPERHADLRTPENLTLSPNLPYRTYTDHFGNICTRLTAPVGKLSLSNRFVIADSGLPEKMPEGACEIPVEEMPDNVLLYLLGSRYCETQKLSSVAWSLFGGIKPGWPRVKAILDYTHDRIKFGYVYARSDRTAWEAYQERVGVCRDFAHLAIALCRCMNIPARYCTGYLGDIGVPIDPNPMDFSAWFEVYLNGAWHQMDARHNHPRIGRILMAVGRDATDTAISVAFGVATLSQFTVITEELTCKQGAVPNLLAQPFKSALG
jgi:transglutaminase-like putative cysteine protease